MGQHAFDLAQFDAKTAHLDLVVGTPQIHQIAILQVAHHIASAVQARASPVRQRIAGKASRRNFDKSLCGQFRALVVAACNTITANVEFTLDPHRHWLAIAVEHVQLCVGNGSPDGYGRQRDKTGTAHRIAGAKDAAANHRFSRAVFVDQLGLRGMLQPRRDMAL